MPLTRKGRFLAAVRRNDVARVEKYLDKGFPVEFETLAGRNALIYAVIDGHREMAEMLIRRGANFSRQYYHYLLGDGRNETLLHIAAELGRKEIVDLLLAHDKYDHSLVNRMDSGRNTALHLAAARGHLDIVKTLLDHGFDPAQKGANGRTPAGFAHQGGHAQVLELINAATAKAAQRPAPPPEPPKPPAQQWKLVSPDSVAHVSEMPDIGYRLTDLFNFSSGERIRIVNNLKTKADSVETASFSSLPDAQVEEALAALVKLGGNGDLHLRGKVARPARLSPPDARP